MVNRRGQRAGRTPWKKGWKAEEMGMVEVVLWSSGVERCASVCSSAIRACFPNLEEHSWMINFFHFLVPAGHLE